MLHNSLEQDRTDVKICPYNSLVMHFTILNGILLSQTGHHSDIKQL